MSRFIIVTTEEQARRVLEHLWAWSEPVGVDTETTGCNPRKQSPVGRAKLYCMTLAWGLPDKKTPSPFTRAFIPLRFLHIFKSWLESQQPKCGTKLWGYDRHVFWNHGIELNGIVADTLDMSRLLNPSTKLKDGKGHGLKQWGERMGYQVRPLTDVAGRLEGGACRVSKTNRVQWVNPETGKTIKKKDVPNCPGAYPVYHFEGAESQNVKWKKRELIPLADVETLYPNRFMPLVEYATQDGAMSLDNTYLLKAKLEKREWM